MENYQAVLMRFVSSEIRKRTLELLIAPEVILNCQLKCYNKSKSELEARPDRLPRMMELELMLKIIEEDHAHKSSPLCAYCANNKQLAEFLRMDPGSVPVVKDAEDVYKQVICDKVKVTLEDELMYICPHFEKLKDFPYDAFFEKPSKEEKQVICELKKEYHAELEKLSGSQHRRRI